MNIKLSRDIGKRTEGMDLRYGGCCVGISMNGNLTSDPDLGDK